MKSYFTFTINNEAIAAADPILSLVAMYIIDENREIEERNDKDSNDDKTIKTITTTTVAI